MTPTSTPAEGAGTQHDPLCSLIDAYRRGVEVRWPESAPLAEVLAALPPQWHAAIKASTEGPSVNILRLASRGVFNPGEGSVHPQHWHDALRLWRRGVEAQRDAERKAREDRAVAAEVQRQADERAKAEAERAAGEAAERERPERKVAAVLRWQAHFDEQAQQRKDEHARAVAVVVAGAVVERLQESKGAALPTPLPDRMAAKALKRAIWAAVEVKGGYTETQVATFVNKPERSGLAALRKCRKYPFEGALDLFLQWAGRAGAATVKQKERARGLRLAGT